MIKTKLCAFFLTLATAVGLQAQVTTSPSPLKVDDKNIVITFHADQGSAGLKDLTASTPVYAHTGVITTKSTGDSDWKHAPSWGDNSDKYKLNYVSTNTWQLIIPDINEYYGVEDDEIVTKLAFVFRNGDCSKEGKATGNKDILVELDGFFMTLTSNRTGNVTFGSTNTATFTASTTKSANITITVNGTQVASGSNKLSLATTQTFTNPGAYTVTAKATASGYPDREETINFFYAPASAAINYPGGTPKMGTVKNDDGSVTFCVAAPNKTSAVLVGSWNDYAYVTEQSMNYQNVTQFVAGRPVTIKYFWVTVKGLENDKMYPYYFNIDGTKIADPYAKLALDQYDAYLKYEYEDLPAYPTGLKLYPLSVYQGNINDYDWKVKDFHGVAPENLIIYELLFRDFTGIEGQSGDNGTIRQAIEKFDHIKNLGVNAVELLPIMEFNGASSWGYNTNLYMAPDKAYGTPDDYKEFIDLCHQNGIAVILDIVFNQAQDHPWLTLYGSTAASPFFNASAPHDYSVLNDWYQDYPVVDEHWKDVLQYWLKEYKVDGFRFDLVKGLGDNSSYGSGTEAYNASRVARMKKLHEYIKEIKPDAYHINENLAGAQEENEMAADGQLNWVSAINNAACQFAMGYASGATLGNSYAPTYGRTWGSTISYLESHDEERLAYKQDQYAPATIKNSTSAKCQRLGSTAAQLLLTPGAHMIWQFGEIGNAQTTKNSDGSNNTDCKKVNWSLLNDADHKGLYDNYCELVKLRTGFPKLFAKDAALCNISITTNQSQANENNWPNPHYIYLQSADKTQELYLIVNPKTSGSLTVSNVPFLTKNNSAYQIASQSYGSTSTFDATAGTVTVPANCYAVITTTNVSGIEDLVSDKADSFKAYGTTGNLVLQNVSSSVDVYSIDGRRVAVVNQDAVISLTSGVYVVKSGKETVKVVVK